MNVLCAHRQARKLLLQTKQRLAKFSLHREITILCGTYVCKSTLTKMGQDKVEYLSQVRFILNPTHQSFEPTELSPAHTSLKATSKTNPRELRSEDEKCHQREGVQNL